MKAIIGIYDASLGARSNETSGRAIMARQREGDVSTFHFIDNLSRAIRHGGRILLDLIPKVYSTERMIRVLGEDMQPASVRIAPTGQPVRDVVNALGQAIGAPFDGAQGRVYDITAGKYDLTVAAGPAYTTRREEVATVLTEVMRSVPDSAPFLASRLAKLLDLPDADELASELRIMNPALKQSQGMKQDDAQQMQGLALIQQLRQENAQLHQQMRDRGSDRQIELQKLGIEQFRAETERLKVTAEMAGQGAPGLAVG